MYNSEAREILFHHLLPHEWPLIFTLDFKSCLNTFQDFMQILLLIWNFVISYTPPELNEGRDGFGLGFC